MTRTLAVITAASLLVLTGCGINGTWTLQTVEPDEARGQFKLAEVTFNDDGTYTAQADYANDEETSTGTWTYKADTLTLHTDSGKTLEYDAELCEMCNTLKVCKEEHGQMVTATMKRK